MYQVTFKYNKENLHVRPQGLPLLSDAYLRILKSICLFTKQSSGKCYYDIRQVSS